MEPSEANLDPDPLRQFETWLGIPRAECHELRSRAMEECERLHTCWSFTLFWGQKTVPAR